MRVEVPNRLWFTSRVIVVVLTWVLALTPAWAGTIEGRVVLDTRATAAPPTSRYAAGTAYDAGPPDPPTAIVYVDVAGSAPAAPRTAEVAQHRYQFAPGLLAIRRGTTVSFPNRDDEYHSVFSYSKAKRFDLGRYQRDETPATITFDQPGLVKLFCEIHDHMRGAILVLDTPHFTTTDTSGRFRLDGVPAGRQVARAWASEHDIREMTVEVPERGTVTIDFPAP